MAISDTTGKYAPLFKATEEYTFITEKGSSLEEYRKNPDKEIFAFLNITDDLLQNPTAATLYSQKQIPMGLKNTIDISSIMMTSASSGLSSFRSKCIEVVRLFSSSSGIPVSSNRR